MPDLSTRINALIAYLFLGPILLLAKSGTPLADPYVRGHAKRASLIILMGTLVFFVYRLVREWITFSIFGIGIDTIILTAIVSLTLIALIVGAYRAFNGKNANETTWNSLHIPENTIQEGVYSEEDKIRIIASFIPFVGIIVANKYPKQETIIGRKIGSLFMFIFLTCILFLEGSTTTLALIVTLIFIGLIVTTTVYLFGFSRFLNFRFYTSIPTYLEFDASIKAGIVTVFDFFRIAFGGEQRSNYQEQYTLYLAKNKQVQLPTLAYFAPNWLIAIPIINLITLPSIWQEKYREYLPIILQGLVLSVFTGLIIYFYGVGSQMELYLLFPVITLIVESEKNLLVRAPITSIIVDIYTFAINGKNKIAEIRENGEEKVTYTYEVKE